jgi:hypothetical protein
MNPEKDRGLSRELPAALEGLLAAREALSERISEYNQQIAEIASKSYPQEARRGRYVGLQPGRRNSRLSELQLHSSKEGGRICGRYWCRGASYSGSVWSGQRSATRGTEAGRRWREEWEEMSRDCDGAKVS